MSDKPLPKLPTFIKPGASTTASSSISSTSQGGASSSTAGSTGSSFTSSFAKPTAPATSSGAASTAASPFATKPAPSPFLSGQASASSGAASTAASPFATKPAPPPFLSGQASTSSTTSSSSFAASSAASRLGSTTGASTTPGSAPAPSCFSSTLGAGATASDSASLSSSSSFGARSVKITDEEFTQLRDFIYEQCGIYIAENRKYLIENRFTNRLKELNLKTFGEYYYFLRYDVSRKTELSRLFEVITTNETSFYRNPPQLDVFRENVLKKILAEQRASGQKKLRIWSAGCSTGDEPYTIAMIIHEVLQSEISGWDIKITANDLSEAVLASARQGIYTDYSLRTTPPNIISKYFTKEANQYRVNANIKRLITFGQINLNDAAQLRRVEKSHIVFCRNVIIYFDDDMKKRVINAFYDNLLPSGYLIIGHSESLHNISRAFKPEHYTGAIMYSKQ